MLFGSFSELWVHLKHKHNCNGFSIFQCGNCADVKKFHNIALYKSHYQNFHNHNIVCTQHNTQSRDKVLDMSSCSSLSNNDKPSIDFGIFKQELLKVTTELYGRSKMSRQDITFIFEKFMHFTQLTSSLFCGVRIQSIGISNSNTFDNLDNKAALLEDLFKNFLTEAKRVKQLVAADLLLQSTTIQIFPDVKYKIVPRGKSVVQVGEFLGEVTIQLFPLKETLKKIFEMPGVYDRVMSYQKSLEQDDAVLSNFVQGKVWKEKKKHFQGRDVAPAFVFYDGWESGDPLGSHAGQHEIGGVYLSIPIFPPEFQSCLSSIFNALSFNVKSVAQVGYNAIFEPLVDLFRDLQTNGVELTLPQGNKRLYFVLGLFLGDNKGLNELLGFVASFVGNQCCKFCKMERVERRVGYEEDVSILRNKLNFQEEELKLGDSSKTGVKFDSVFNSLEFYHVTDNWAVDVMHDLLEGDCASVMTMVIQHYVVGNLKEGVRPAFSLAELHYTNIKKMNYSPGVNRPP